MGTRAKAVPGDRTPVALLPGGIQPVAASYRELLAALGDEVEPLLKDYELYAGEVPPPGWSLDTEVEGLRQAAEGGGFGPFHLLGYSGGGAIALAFAVRYPERVRSLALVEPAWVGNDGLSPEEVAYWEELGRAVELPPAELLREFTRANLPSGMAPPAQPQGPPPSWLARRPAGLRLLVRAFINGRLDHERLRRFPSPVFVAVGSLSRVVERRKAERLASILPDCRVEVYEGTHHFAPPHREAPERLAGALRGLWARAAAGWSTPPYTTPGPWSGAGTP
ncbi:MAG: alpha/beta hydrolase [Chloroflexi bacterium]|nr:alpha/beta hydrolase [Chloroflexota bacterium]